jgi:putative acetyltransferase
MTRVRAEEAGDREAVYALNAASFEDETEAKLVDALREQADPVISLVAIAGDQVVGHILFSPVTHSANPAIRLMGLAPMAVAPGHQRNGTGSALVRAGLEQCRLLGCDAVVVLGHADYYPRFGFEPSTRFGIRSEYEVPDEVFMAIELTSGALRDAPGVVRYHPAFAAI